MHSYDNRISVALAVYNGEKYLQQLLLSLEQQTIKPFEIVILNDCSTDNSETVIRQFQFSCSEVHYYKNDSNIGHLLAFKKLAGLCQGDFIAFCDQDDIWLPDKLELCFEHLSVMPKDKPSVVFTDLALINDNGNLVAPSFWNYYNIRVASTNFFDVLGNNVITGCTTFVNRSMLNEIKKMPEEALLHDYWMALIAYGFGCYHSLYKATVHYRIHAQTVTQKYKTSFLKKVLRINKTSVYFLKKVKQAKKFSMMYGNKLSEDKRRELSSFLSAKNSSFIKAGIIKKIRKYNSKKGSAKFL